MKRTDERSPDTFPPAVVVDAARDTRLRAETNPSAPHLGLSVVALQLALDTLPMPILVLSKGGRVAAANSAATLWLQSKAGRCWSAQARGLASVPLLGPRNRGAETDGLLVTQWRSIGGDDVRVLLRPLPEATADPDHVLAFVSTAGMPIRADQYVIAAEFGLSAAEADIARRLADGERLPVIAKARGVTMHTARAQLKTLLQKMRVNNQAGVVAAVLRGLGTLRLSDR